jgi:hypothetical protein
MRKMCDTLTIFVIFLIFRLAGSRPTRGRMEARLDDLGRGQHLFRRRVRAHHWKGTQAGIPCRPFRLFVY